MSENMPPRDLSCTIFTMSLLNHLIPVQVNPSCRLVGRPLHCGPILVYCQDIGVNTRGYTEAVRTCSLRAEFLETRRAARLGTPHPTSNYHLTYGALQN
jgi:hypothetical protein